MKPDPLFHIVAHQKARHAHTVSCIYVMYINFVLGCFDSPLKYSQDELG